MQGGGEFVANGHQFALIAGGQAVEFRLQRLDVETRAASVANRFLPYVMRLADRLALEAMFQRVADRLG